MNQLRIENTDSTGTTTILIKDGRWTVNDKPYLALTDKEKHELDQYIINVRTQLETVNVNTRDIDNIHKLKH